MKKPIAYALAATLGLGTSTYPVYGQQNPDTSRTLRPFSPPILAPPDTRSLEESIAEIEQKVSQNPTVDDLNHLTSLYKSDNKLDKAEDTAKKVIDIDPNNPVPYKNLGYIFRIKKQFDKAEEDRKSVV